MWAAHYVLGIQDKAGEAAEFGSHFEHLIAIRMGFNEIEFTGEDGKRAKCSGAEYEERFCNREVHNAVDRYLEQPWAWRSARQTQRFVRITPAQWAEWAEHYGADPELCTPLVGYIDFDRFTPESEGLGDALRPLEIMDTKTISRDDWKQDWAHQLTLYALATGATRAHIHRWVRGKPKLVAEKTIDYSKPENRKLVKETMDRTAYYVREITQVIKLPGLVDHLPRNPGWACAYCPLLHECPSAQVFNKAEGHGGVETVAVNFGGESVDGILGQIGG